MTNPTDRQVTLKLTAHSEPFRDDPEDAEAYYTAIGRALVLWGRLENHLSRTLLAIYNLPDAEPFKSSEMPVSFKRRSKLWRCFFRSMPILADMRDDALLLIADIGDANQDRIVMIHGHFNGFVADNPLTARFLLHSHKGDRIIFKRYDVPISVLKTMSNTFDSLNTRMLPISWNVSSLHFR